MGEYERTEIFGGCANVNELYKAISRDMKVPSVVVVRLIKC